MNKILSFIAITAFCTITTVMNGALPPGEEWQKKAREVAKILEEKGLPEPAVRLIQEYLSYKSIEIVNANTQASDLNILFQDAATGKKLADFILFVNPHENSVPFIIPEEEPFERMVKLPLIPMTITVKSRWCGNRQPLRPWSDEGSVTLTPPELEKIKEMEFAGRYIFKLTYTDGSTSWKSYDK